MKIGGLMKLTLLDYPEKVACTVFTVGCNFKCPFCHNASLVSATNCEQYTTDEILQFLNKRKNVLEGMCLTGGEPLLQSGVEEFLRKVKELGYSVKLDTNGSFPQKLKDLIDKKLVDYVAMDVKNSIALYPQTAGCADNDGVKQSVELLKSNVVDYEFRTTLVRELHTEADLDAIAAWLEGAPKYFLQNFVDSGNLIGQGHHGFTPQELHGFADRMRPYFGSVEIRGVD